MGDRDLALAAHLMRRAGFGASRGELETLATRPYDDVVDDLLHPERFPDIDTDLCDRYYGWDNYHGPAVGWMYRMAVTRRPLQEKMALFWHHVFATAFFKSEHVASLNRQVEMFRRVRHVGHAHHPAGAVARPGHDLLAGQQRERERRAQRELRPRAAGAVLDGRRQLHRDWTSRMLPGRSRAGPSRSPSRCTPTATTTRTSSAARRSTTTG